MKETTPLCLRTKAVTSRSDISGEWIVTGSEVAQWVNKLNVMEDKIKKQETNFWVLGAL